MQAADNLGRKPVLIVSLIGVIFATALFGLSQSLWQMILFRCVAGIFAGNVVLELLHLPCAFTES
jgi:MFS family permease